MRNLTLILSGCILLAGCNGSRKLTETDKEKIITELNEIRQIDQKYAGIPSDELFEEYGRKKAWEIFMEKRDSVGLVNQEKIKNIFKEYGYLGEKRIGKEAAVNFWLPIQHADNDVKFQQKMLEALKLEIEKGSEDLYHYAMLEDRINANLKKPQRFGSQLTYNELGQAVPKFGLVDTTRVDSLRKAYGMPSFKEYYNMMTKMHFERNKQMFLEKGITEPKLYE